nr:reverse transcriptase domain-containing protein [Tanacetum cinerariifolium]
MYKEDIEEADIAKTTMVKVSEIGMTADKEMKIINYNILVTTGHHQTPLRRIPMNPILRKPFEQGQKNHQAAIHDLETKFDRLSDEHSATPSNMLPTNTQSNPKPSGSNDKPYRLPQAQNEHVIVVFTRSGKTSDPPPNPNDRTIIIHDGSDDEAEEAAKEDTPTHSNPNKSDPPPVKAYKPKIAYPQRLRKEKMEELYAKFMDMIKEVRINVPLVYILVGMPNYEKFLKELMSNKIKLEQNSDAFLNEECSAIVQNKIPLKLNDPESFLISCTLGNLITYTQKPTRTRSVLAQGY